MPAGSGLQLPRRSTDTICNERRDSVQGKEFSQSNFDEQSVWAEKDERFEKSVKTMPVLLVL